MLSSINLNDRDYNDFFQEAVNQIPLYSREWTNYNLSDPGITILQNFAAFHNLQQSSINMVTDEVKLKLLELLGFHKQHNVAAVVVAAPTNIQGETVIVPDTKYTVESLCLESIRTERVKNNKVIAAFSQMRSEISDISSMTYEILANVVYPFGKQPKVGNTFYFMMAEQPRPLEELLFYLMIDTDERRNSFEKNSSLSFADIKWQCYTSDGWKEVETKDDTHAFVCSGEIEILTPETPMVPYKLLEKEGYAFRCILTSEEYDLPPCVRQLTGNLIRFRQQDTKSKILRLKGAESVSCCSQMLSYDFVKAYCREEGGSHFYKYEEYDGDSDELLRMIEKFRNGRIDEDIRACREAEDYFSTNVQKGRYYILRRHENCTNEYVFSKEAFGFMPEETDEAVCVVCYGDDVLNHYKLGTVYGYDSQELEIGLLKQLLPESFSVIVESIGKGGETQYSFLRPDETGEDGLRYELNEKDGKIIIREAGISDCCFLYMGDAVLTAGEKGNIRENNTLKPFQSEDRIFDVPDVSFMNPSSGTGGVISESIMHITQRFKEDMLHPATAVLVEDYEKIIKAVPGLCIRKVKAMSDKHENMIRVAVLPYSVKEYPLLSELYRSEIQKYAERARIITTRLQLVSPQYIPIHVQGTIYVKSHFKKSQEMIEDLLRSELDYLNSDKQFGEVLKYNELYHKIESLPCVEYIYDLKLRPQAGKDAKMKALDIYPAEYCLCCPGQFVLEVNSHAVIQSSIRR